MKNHSLLCFVLSCLLLSVARAQAPKEILLWPNGAPGSEGKSGDEAVRVTQDGEHVVSNIHKPSITPYLPAKGKATGAAVVVAPGGGHRELWMDHEGHNFAQWLATRGIARLRRAHQSRRNQTALARHDPREAIAVRAR
jgi:endo-1,4-beta-xylanase